MKKSGRGVKKTRNSAGDVINIVTAIDVARASIEDAADSLAGLDPAAIFADSTPIDMEKVRTLLRFLVELDEVDKAGGTLALSLTSHGR